MPRSRLRWRALAVLGALLSVMIDWPIGSAMPAANNFQPPVMACLNCSNTSSSSANVNLTNSDRIATSVRSNSNVNSSDSGASTNSNSKRSSKSDHADRAMIMPSTIVSTIEKGIVSNSNRPPPPERDMAYRNKRKRKKSMAVLTADQIPTRSIRTHNNVSSSSDVNNLINNNPNNINFNNSASFINSNDSDESINKYNTSVEPTTTMHAILDDAEDSALVISTDGSPAVAQHLSRTERSVHQSIYRHQNGRSRTISNSSSSNSSSSSSNNTNLDRNERSANLSHISGPAKKIQLYIKTRWIQVLPDGTINGTQDDSSDYTILQRTTVNVGQIKIQGVATCLFLCMDPCGAVYGSKTFTDDCVFNESMEQHHYNTYSSTYNSDSHRTLYLALNRLGQPRRTQIPRSRSLGKLATYTKAMTSTVDEDRVEKLIARTFGANRIKHGLRQLCDAGKPLIELTTDVLKLPPKCTPLSGKLTSIGNSSSSNNSNNSGSHNDQNRKNKKKNRRRCRPHENEQEHKCQVRAGPQALKRRAQNRKCKATQTPEECARMQKKGGKKQNKGANQKKRKNNGGTAGMNNNRRGKSPLAGRRKTTPTTTSTSTRATTTTLSTTPPTSNSSREMVETTTTTTTIATSGSKSTSTLPTLARSVRTQTIRQELSVPISNEEENVSTEDSQQLHMHSSTEMHDGGDVEDEGGSMSALGAHEQMVNGDDWLYDDDLSIFT